MNHSLLSIITIAYNAESTIRDTLVSVEQAILNVPNDSVEHIIIEGCSTDRTKTVARSFPHALVYSEKDNGISDAFNKGIDKASGRWLLFLNADDTLYNEQTLLDLLQLIQSVDQQVLLMYGMVQMVDHQTGEPRHLLGRENIHKFLFLRMLLPHQATIFHKSYFEKFGKFDHSFKIGMDYELILRAYSYRDQFKFIPIIISKMNDGGISQQRKSLGLRERSRALKKHKIGLPFWPEINYWIYRARSLLPKNLVLLKVKKSEYL